MLKTLHKTKIKNWLTVNRKLQSFAFISTNSLYSEKDSSNIANIIKIRKEKNDLSQPFRLAWNLRSLPQGVAIGLYLLQPFRLNGTDEYYITK